MNDGQILINLKEGHGSTEEYMRRLRTALREKFPIRDFLFPACGHHHPDPELRPPGADRHPGGRATMPTTIGVSRSISCRGSRRCAAPSTCICTRSSIPELFRQRRSGARVADRLDRAADRKRSQYLAELQLPGIAEFLGRSENRSALPGGRADARVPPEQHERPRRTRRSGYPAGTAPSSKCFRTLRRCRASRCRR